MPDKQVTMTLKATDGASKVFKAVGQSGDAMGKQVAQAAQTASRGLEQMDQSASRAGQGLGQYRDNLQQVGLGLGALGGLLAVSGQSFRNQEVQIEALRRGYGDAADDLIKFTESLQDTTNFSNDAGVAAANIFRTLSENYGFTADQIQQLITVSADLAASQGIGLADAAMRVQSAMRGEAESAEYLGLTLNDSALGIDRLSMSVGQNERAQIRFIALQDQASFAMGTAQQQAEGTYGTMANLRDSVNDNAQALGDFLGPFGDIGAFAADNAVQIGLLSLAVGQMGKAAIGVNTLATSLTGVSASSAVAGSGIAGLAGMAGIAGLGIAATIAVTGGVGLLIGKLAVDTPKAAGDATNSIQDLIDAALELDSIGAIGADLLDIQDATAYNDAIIELTGHVNELMDIGYTVQREGSKSLTDSIFAGFSEGALEVLDRNGDLQISFDELDATVNALTGDNMAMAQSAADMNTMLAKSADEINTIMHLSGPGAERAKEGLDNLLDAYMKSPESVGNLEEALQGVIQTFHDTQAATLDANGALADGVNGWTAHTQAVTAANAAMQSYFDTVDQPGAGQSVAESFGLDDEWFRDLDRANAGLQGYLDIEQQIAAGAVAAGPQIKKFMDELSGPTGSKSFGGEFKFDANFGEALNAFDIESARDRIIKAYDDIATAPEALDNGYRVIISNTNAIADSADSVAKWAAEMTDAAEGMSKLDSILDSNSVGLSAATINQEEYNAAQEAFRDIQRENVEIAQDVAVIQAKQAPILAELMAGTENYMQKIAEMDGIQQTAALGFMDSAESAQALQLRMLALDAASGALGTNGRQWASGIIEGAAMADPVLKAMLLDMGLISEGADGTITVNFDDNATSPLQQIVAAVQELNETTLLLVAILDDDPFTNTAKDVEDKMNSIGEMEQYPIVGVNDQTDTPLRKIIANMAVVGDTTETPTVNLQDNASGSLREAIGLLNEFDGRNAYASITTQYITIGNPTASGNQPMQHGGVLPAAQHGRVIKGSAIVGEAGWEEIWAPGAFVTPHTASVQDMKAKSGINLNLTIEGNIYGIDDLVSQVVDVVTPALGRALDIQRRSLSA